MVKDPCKYIYTVAEEDGECVDNILGRYSKKDDKVQWFRCSHVKSDGVGAWTKRMEFDGIPIPEQPAMKTYKIPNLLRRVGLMFRHIRSIHPVKYPWKNYDNEKMGAGAGFGYALFSAEESKKFLEYCRSQKVTLTGFLLMTLDRVTLPYVLTEKSERSWLIPVNMRGGVKVKDIYANYTASIGIRFKKEQDPTMQGIHEELQRLYKDGIPWGAFAQVTVVKYMGLRLLRFINKRSRKLLDKSGKRSFIGVYSNMGNWDPPGKEGFGSENYRYISAGPVSTMGPVTAVSLSWRGKLALTMQIHPRLTDDINHTVELLQFWVDEMRRTASMGPEFKDDVVRVEPRDSFYANAIVF